MTRSSASEMKISGLRIPQFRLQLRRTALLGQRSQHPQTGLSQPALVLDPGSSKFRSVQAQSPWSYCTLQYLSNHARQDTDTAPVSTGHSHWQCQQCPKERSHFECSTHLRHRSRSHCIRVDSKPRTGDCRPCIRVRCWSCRNIDRSTCQVKEGPERKRTQRCDPSVGSQGPRIDWVKPPIHQHRKQQRYSRIRLMRAHHPLQKLDTASESRVPGQQCTGSCR
mmetsp:Transcript_35461/g.52067  ORF Transcript_35461/g.52067 Transcript_35461/m.52067 type:complete len:223 (-) Transcript_35461:1435-2103(-)